MPKTRQQKEDFIKDFNEKLQQAKSIVFVHFDGLKVKEIEDLRKLFRIEKIDYIVAKKTLLKKAFEQAGVENYDPATFEREVGVAFGIEDEVAPARIIQQFSKDHEALQAFGGVLENSFVGQEKIIELAKLPSREELLARVVSSINAPVSGFVNALAGNLRNLVYVLSAVRDSK